MTFFEKGRNAAILQIPLFAGQLADDGLRPEGSWGLREKRKQNFLFMAFHVNLQNIHAVNVPLLKNFPKRPHGGWNSLAVQTVNKPIFSAIALAAEEHRRFRRISQRNGMKPHFFNTVAIQIRLKTLAKFRIRLEGFNLNAQSQRRRPQCVNARICPNVRETLTSSAKLSFYKLPLGGSEKLRHKKKPLLGEISRRPKTKPESPTSASTGSKERHSFNGLRSQSRGLLKIDRPGQA